MLAFAALLLLTGSAIAQSSSQRSSTESAESTKPVASYLFPPNRGTHSLVSRVAPCQGWELGLRVDYPLTGGVVSWAATKDISNVQIRYTTNADPQSQDDFQTALSNITGGFTGQQCIDGPNFAALGLSAGDHITMQLTYQTGPGKWDMYECADLNLVSADAFTAGNWDTQCLNRVAGTQTKRVSASNPNLYKLQQEAEASAAAESGSSSDSGPSRVESGVVGAMVTLAVALLAIVLAYFAGMVAFGKRAKTVKHQRAGSYTEHADVKTVNSV